MDTGPTSPSELAALAARIDAWLEHQLGTNPSVAAIDRDRELTRWYLRVNGEDKDVYTIWFTLDQRSLHYETYVMPAPEENEAEFYAHLLRRNLKLRGVHFAIGEEDAIFLQGELRNEWVDEDELDRIVGTVYAAVELCFVPALRIGFASRMG